MSKNPLYKYIFYILILATLFFGISKIIDLFILKNLTFFNDLEPTLYENIRPGKPYKKIGSLLKYGVFIVVIGLSVIFHKKIDEINPLEKLLSFLKNTTINSILKLNGIAAAVIYLTIFTLLIFSDKYVLNDYLYVQQQTKLPINEKIVNDIEFINDNNLLNMKIFNNEVFGKESASITASESELREFNTHNKIKPKVFEYRGYYFYHHAYNFGPMQSLSLGQDTNSLVMIYGWLSTVTQSKILNFFGSLNFQNYLNLYYFEYIIYFTAYLLILWAIFKNIFIVSLGAILYTSTILLLGIELIKLAPGFNPIRHFFDILIIYYSFLFFSKNSKKYLIIASTFALFSIFWSKDFGFYISLSLGITLIIHSIRAQGLNRIGHQIFSVLFVVTAIALYLYKVPGSNPSGIYFFLGIGAPTISNLVLIIWCVLIGALVFFNFTMPIKKEYVYANILACLYSLMSFTYYLWYPKDHHIYGVGSIYIIWILFIVNNLKKIKVLNYISVFSNLIFAYSIAIFTISTNDYLKYINNHLVYDFRIKGHDLKSLGSPIDFQIAIDLIEKYSLNESGIYLISKYDYLLAMLSNKNSKMGYVEIWSNLVSPKEVNGVVDVLLKNRPKVIYVDSDIVNEVVYSKLEYEQISTKLLPIRGAGIARDIPILGGPMREIYLYIKDHYVVCDKSNLVYVLCLK